MWKMKITPLVWCLCFPTCTPKGQVVSMEWGEDRWDQSAFPFLAKSSRLGQRAMATKPFLLSLSESPLGHGVPARSWGSAWATGLFSIHWEKGQGPRSRFIPGHADLWYWGTDIGLFKNNYFPSTLFLVYIFLFSNLPQFNSFWKQLLWTPCWGKPSFHRPYPSVLEIAWHSLNMI